MTEPLSFEQSRPERAGAAAARRRTSHAPGRRQTSCRRDALRAQPPDLPRLSEPEIMRHYSRLASLNYSISEQFYPLGSCTMKYNPVANEAAAALPGLRRPASVPGRGLGAGRPRADVAPGAGAVRGRRRRPGDAAAGRRRPRRVDGAAHDPGLSTARAATTRTEVLVPDSAHGTNPASAALSGFQVVEVKSGPDGRISLADLESKLSPRVAALMLTNPNTLGLFEREILDVAEMVHATGAMLYYDGANLNAFMGICRPGDMGFDAVHMNLHKTFTTPHGGGGPGAGPVGVKADLVPFLPHAHGGEARMGTSRSTSSGRSRSAGCAASTATSGCSSAPTRTSSRWAATA